MWGGEKRDPKTHRTPSQKRRDTAWRQKTPEGKRKKAERHKARAMMVKAGKAHKGDGKEVDHKRPLAKGGATIISNLRMKSAKSNRTHTLTKPGNRKR